MQLTSSEEFNWGEADAYSTHYLKGPVRELLTRLAGKKLLDLGCGNGSLTKHLTDLDYQIIGCDPDEKGLEIARRNAPDAQFIRYGVYDPPDQLPHSPFDVVLSSEVIEHLFYPRRLVEFAKEVLTPNGYLVLTTPYHGYLKNVAIAVCNKWDFHHNPLHDGGHIKFWSLNTIKELVTPYGFQVVEFHGAGRVKWLWKSMIVVCQLKQ